ncbi:MAG: hypothetical protein LBT75_00705 [Bacilli bacterium]|jgi:hypothetical protein|nr:hypothetical protein [Bacilli bacterium]
MRTSFILKQEYKFLLLIFLLSSIILFFSYISITGALDMFNSLVLVPADYGYPKSLVPEMWQVFIKSFNGITAPYYIRDLSPLVAFVICLFSPIIYSKYKERLLVYYIGKSNNYYKYRKHLSLKIAIIIASIFTLAMITIIIICYIINPTIEVENIKEVFASYYNTKMLFIDIIFKNNILIMIFFLFFNFWLFEFILCWFANFLYDYLKNIVFVMLVMFIIFYIIPFLAFDNIYLRPFVLITAVFTNYNANMMWYHYFLPYLQLVIIYLIVKRVKKYEI